MQPTQRATEVDERSDGIPRSRKRGGKLVAALGSRLQGRGACGWPAHQVLADVLGSLRREEAERGRRSPVEKEAVLQGRQGEQEPTSQSHRVNRASPWRRGRGQGPLCLRDPESHQEQRKASAVWKTTTLRRSHAEVSVSVQ